MPAHDLFNTVDLFESKNMRECHAVTAAMQPPLQCSHRCHAATVAMQHAERPLRARISRADGVLTNLHSLGRVLQRLPSYKGPVLGAKLATRTQRTFSAEQLRKAQNVIPFMSAGSQPVKEREREQVAAAAKARAEADDLALKEAKIAAAAAAAVRAARAKADAEDAARNLKMAEERSRAASEAIRAKSWGVLAPLGSISSLPCLALPCLALPCRAVPCRALPCLALP